MVARCALSIIVIAAVHGGCGGSDVALAHPAAAQKREPDVLVPPPFAANVADPTAVPFSRFPRRPWTIAILDAGSEPRAPLRFALRAGVYPHTTTTIWLEHRVARKDPTSAPPHRVSPRVRLEFETTIGEPAVDGSALIKQRVVKAEILDRQARADWDDFPKAWMFVDATIDMIMTPRGLPASVLVHATGKLGPYLQLLTMSVPVIILVPRDPVSAGARWRASGLVDLGGFEAPIVFEYQLTERSGNLVRIAGSSRARGPVHLDPSMTTGTASAMTESTFDLSVDMTTAIPTGVTTNAAHFAITGDDAISSVDEISHVEVSPAVSPSGP